MISGRAITRTGRWKRYLVGGMVLVVVGLALLSMIDEKTPLVVIGCYMFAVGVGLGASMQNLVLAVQNNAAQADIGSASAVVTFFRSMGGSVGVSALGAVLSAQVADKVAAGLTALHIPVSGHQSHQIPDLASLPAPVRAVFEHAFGASTGELFLIATPFALAALVAVLFIHEVPLRTTIARDDELGEVA
jgi:uncharacterized membrane protein